MRRDLRVTWTLAVCTALALFGDATMYAALPSQYHLVGIAAVSVGWMLSINRLVRPPLNFASGWLTDRIGPKVPYVVGVGIGVLSTAGYGLVRGFWPFLALRALWGLAWAMLVVAAYAMILEVSTPETRGRLTGLYASFSFFGGAFGPLLGGFLVDTQGFRTAMLVLAACTAVGCALALTLPRTRAHARVGAAARSGEAPWRRPAAAWARLRDVLRGMDRRLMLIASLNFAHRFFFAGIFYGTFGRYLLVVVGEELRVGALVVGVTALTGTLMFARNVITVAVGPSLGYLSDRLRDRPSVLILGELLGVAGLAAFSLSGSLWAVLLGVVLAAAAYGIVPPLLVAWMGDVAGDGRKGPLVGGYQTMGDLGSGIAPALAYPLLDAIGVRTLYGLSAACLALSVPLILRYRRGAAAAARAPVREATAAPDCAPEG